MVPFVVSAVIACVFVCVLRECERDSNADVGPGKCGYGECLYVWYTWFRCFV